MAAMLKTSRTQINRLLDPKNDITLLSLQRAAAIVGRRVSIEISCITLLQFHLKPQRQQLAEGHGALALRRRKHHRRIGQR